MYKKKLRRAPVLVVLAAALPVMLGACGSSGSPSPNAPAAGADPSSSAQGGQAQFSQCMRQNGVTNFPDPQNGHMVMSGGVQDNPHFQSAMQACQHFLGPGGVGSNQSPAQKQAQLAFAHCMQTHGEPNWPDPQSNGAIVAPPGIDRNSPTYKNAYNACKSNLPGGGTGGVTG